MSFVIDGSGNLKHVWELSLDVIVDNDIGITAKQHDDTSRYLLVTLTADGETVEIPSDYTPYLRGMKADGWGTLTAGSIDNGKAYIELTDSALSTAGKIKADIAVEADGEIILSTMPFIIDVIETPYDGDDIPHDTNVLNKIMREIDASAKTASENAARVLNARMDAFTHLAEGSTTGDAEFRDGRIDIYGYTHTNMGGNIRAAERKYETEIGNSTNALEVLNATRAEGVFNRNTNQIVTGNVVYEHLEYTLSGESSICIDGYQYSAAEGNFVLYAFKNDNDEVIDYYKYGSRDTFQRHVWATVPPDAVKVIVNTRNDALHIDWYGCIFRQSETIGKKLDNFTANTVNVNWQNAGTYRPGIVRKIDGTDNNTQVRYASIVYEITDFRRFSIRGYRFTWNYPAIIVYSGDEIIYKHYGNQDNTSVNFDLTVPPEATKIYINGRVDLDENSRPALRVYSGDIETLETRLDGLLLPKQHYKNAPITDAECDKFREAYGMMLHRMMLTYPNAEIWCATITPCERITSNAGFPDINSDKNTIEDYNRAIRELANAFGCKTINHDSCGISYYNLSDYMGDYASSTGFGLHPNAAGMSILARATVQALTNNGMYADYSDKKLSIMGDSISSYSGYSIWTQAQQYPAYDVTSVNDMWWYKACIDELGMTLVSNNSYGGRAASNIRDDLRENTGCFHQEQIDLLASGSTEPDVIIIKVGVNDFGNVGSDGNTVAEDGGKIWGGLGFYDGTTAINSEN